MSENEPSDADVSSSLKRIILLPLLLGWAILLLPRIINNCTQNNRALISLFFAAKCLFCKKDVLYQIMLYFIYLPNICGFNVKSACPESVQAPFWIPSWHCLEPREAKRKMRKNATDANRRKKPCIVTCDSHAPTQCKISGFSQPDSDHGYDWNSNALVQSYT